MQVEKVEDKKIGHLIQLIFRDLKIHMTHNWIRSAYHAHFHEINKLLNQLTAIEWKKHE